MKTLRARAEAEKRLLDAGEHLMDAYEQWLAVDRILHRAIKAKEKAYDELMECLGRELLR